MKKKHLLSLLLYFYLLNTYAQTNYYYYYNGNKNYLTLDKNNLNISIYDGFQKSTISGFNTETDNYISQSQSFSKLEFQTTFSEYDYFQKISELNRNPDVKNVLPNFITNEGVKVGMSDFFYVKLKNASNIDILQNLAVLNNVQIIEQNNFMPLWYTLRLTKNSTGNTLEIANLFFETGNFESSVPDFLSEDTQTNDPLYSNQWGLNNTGQYNGTNGIDIKINNAWNLTQGFGINIAVIDSGIDKNHEDLSNSISPLSFDTVTNTSPSQLYGKHGTACAGIIGSTKDNNIGIVGVSPKSKIIDISNSMNLSPDSTIKRANGINWAWQNGADVISNSWKNSIQYQFIDDAIQNAQVYGRNGKGTIIVFSSGNDDHPIVCFPARNNRNVIAVGAITQCGERKSPFTCDSDYWGSNYGERLDVVAPGVSINTTDLTGIDGYSIDNYTLNFSGTSAACPHVAGVAALILSVNPCLSYTQVKNIIEQTAQKIGSYVYENVAGRPNGTWSYELGYGLIDAHAAVQMAQQMYSNSLDLIVKDGNDDIGLQPNTITSHIWNSSDIWIRNYDDNLYEHQNPNINTEGSINYIYVKVANKSCVSSIGDEKLKLYWAKASTSLDWDNSWNGSTFITGQKRGDFIGEVPIPIIAPGEEIILKFPWIVPDPNQYTTINPEPWHFCLLARIEAPLDPMYIAETPNLYFNVKNNNNIAWKNVTVVNTMLPLSVDSSGNNNSGVIAVGNPFNQPHTFYLELIKEELETGKPIFDEAEVSLKMDQVLFNAWDRGGKAAQIMEATLDEKKKIIKGNNVILDNLSFYPNEIGTLSLTFNFLIKEITDKSNYVYHVIQKDSETDEIIGGETFIIKKQDRPLFNAYAGGDKEINKNEPITISALQISEPAIYNWYDNYGNLIFSGKDLSISSCVSQKYKLEVIATADGFKDYTEVEIKLKPSSLSVISPNPASNLINIKYNLNEVNSAYLMILSDCGIFDTSNNYILDLNTSEININLENYINGFYTVALVCDGQIVDAKTFIKQ